jgi:hypothetical protein
MNGQCELIIIALIVIGFYQIFKARRDVKWYKDLYESQAEIIESLEKKLEERR